MHKGFAVSQLPERFRSKFDTDFEVVNKKQMFFVKQVPDSPRFGSLKEAHNYIATLETGKLAEYVHRKYSHYGYKLSHPIHYSPEWTPEGQKYAYRPERYRCIENVSPDLRRVGDSDEIVRLRHTGWYMDNYQDETVHGAVYQLPARDGKPQYVPAYDDPYNPNYAVLDFHSITDDKEDAARWADSMAEHCAEEAREYQAKDEAENRINEIAEEIQMLYSDFRDKSRQIRANCDALKGIPVVRELIRNEWQRTKEQIHKLRKERERVEEYGIEY